MRFKNTQKSHVIKAIAVPEEYAYGTIRVSFRKYNSLEDARNIAVEIARILNAEGGEHMNVTMLIINGELAVVAACYWCCAWFGKRGLRALLG